MEVPDQIGENLFQTIFIAWGNNKETIEIEELKCAFKNNTF